MPKRHKDIKHTVKLEPDPPNLSEPEAVYIEKKWEFRSFDSFEEMNEASAKVMASLPGEEHLQNATRLIRAIYKDELNNAMDKNLKFGK